MIRYVHSSTSIKSARRGSSQRTKEEKRRKRRKRTLRQVLYHELLCLILHVGRDERSEVHVRVSAAGNGLSARKGRGESKKAAHPSMRSSSSMKRETSFALISSSPSSNLGIPLTASREPSIRGKWRRGQRQRFVRSRLLQSRIPTLVLAILRDFLHPQPVPLYFKIHDEGTAGTRRRRRRRLASHPGDAQRDV